MKRNCQPEQLDILHCITDHLTLIIAKITNPDITLTFASGIGKTKVYGPL